jgi:hypothetical protein
MSVFMYDHDITEKDQANIINIERLFLNLKRKGAPNKLRLMTFLRK